jgi:hypothetical protein
LHLSRSQRNCSFTTSSLTSILSIAIMSAKLLKRVEWFISLLGERLIGLIVYLLTAFTNKLLLTFQPLKPSPISI